MMKRFVMDIIHAVMRHNIGFLAAVISFFGFSSLVPVLALLILLASWVIPGAAVERFLKDILQSYIPSIPTGKTFAGGTFAVSTIERLIHFGTAVRVIGLVSLVWSTVGGFMALQWILDTIFEVHKRRAFVRQYIVGFAMVGILLALTIASSLVTAISPRFLSRLVSAHAMGAIQLAHLLGWIAFPVILLVTCYCCYRLLPSQSLHNLSLCIGSLLATVCIYVSRLLFGVYSHHLRNYELMYGTLSFVMLFTFWIYIVCNILLFSAEIAAALERAKYGTTTVR